MQGLLRDVAALASVGAANEQVQHELRAAGITNPALQAEQVAARAYELADALLAARARRSAEAPSSEEPHDG